MRTAAALGLLILSCAATAGEQEDRGKYLVQAADCQPCHTKEGGQAWAGGRAIGTPFGTLYSANLTPDKETGIGNWTPDQFYRALHEGIDDEGHHLYPAFPYTYFTRVRREDSDAMLAYLKSLAPVKQEATRNDLTWPFSMRWLLAGWNLLFLKKDEFKLDTAKSLDWNRGAYLVEVLGHCGACHTPMNQAGAPKSDDAWRGGHIGDLFAPDLTSANKTGLGSWSQDDIVAFLKSGRNAHANASAEMGEVVEFSTQHLTDDDLRAIAVYLKDIPASPEQLNSEAPSEAQMKLGKQVFDDNCSACHQPKAEGVPNLFPPLVHSASVQQRDATMLIHVILTGTRTASTDTAPTAASMPAYHWKLSDDEIAAVTTYIRNAWGNSASPVPAKDVADLRKKLIAK
jgi:mono/diheme cytochrome c family protein